MALSNDEMREKIDDVLRELKGRIDQNPEAVRLFNFGSFTDQPTASAQILVYLYADLATIQDRMRHMK